ncbi:MAG: acetate kinase [Planctomycetaceae bacterium]|nr:acetate kinase [Planctomycetaceae bacterium]
MNVLLFNAGSSSLKTTLMAPDGDVLARGLADWAGARTRYEYVASEGKAQCEDVSWSGHTAAVERFVHDLTRFEPVLLRNPRDLSAVGHRIVHGGQFTSSVQITPDVRSRIDALVELAPLHNPPSLATLAAVEAAFPDVRQIAVFDTAFHATLPPEAFTYPVPRQWTHDWGIRRYGFHGLSHAYCAQRATELLDRPLKDLRLVICHLGHGCSASAVQGGRSIDTTMGFTPLDGLMMATRSGAIDPGIVFHIQERYGLTATQVEASLNRQSGLLGVSGVSADMRQVLAAAHAGDEQALLALAIYTHRVRQSIGALAVTMGGVDALVFTAGVGEHAGEVRASICDGLSCLGLEIDRQFNRDCRPDADIASGGSRGRVLVIATREDITMFREVVQVLAELQQ